MAVGALRGLSPSISAAWNANRMFVKCKEDPRSYSLHLILHSAVQIYEFHIFIILECLCLSILW